MTFFVLATAGFFLPIASSRFQKGVDSDGSLTVFVRSRFSFGAFGFLEPPISFFQNGTDSVFAACSCCTFGAFGVFGTFGFFEPPISFFQNGTDSAAAFSGFAFGSRFAFGSFGALGAFAAFGSFGFFEPPISFFQNGTFSSSTGSTQTTGSSSGSGGSGFAGRRAGAGFGGSGVTAATAAALICSSSSSTGRFGSAAGVASPVSLRPNEMSFFQIESFCSSLTAAALLRCAARAGR